MVPVIFEREHFAAPAPRVWSNSPIFPIFWNCTHKNIPD